MRRVMDPLFADSVNPLPAAPAPEPEAPPSQPAHIPAMCDFNVTGDRLQPIPPGLALMDVPFEFELSMAPVRFPLSKEGVIAFDLDFAALDFTIPETAAPEPPIQEFAPQEPATQELLTQEPATQEPATQEPASEPAAEGNPTGTPTIESLRLHPRLQESKPTAIAESAAPASTIDNLAPSLGRTLSGLALSRLSGLTAPSITEPILKGGLAPLITRAGAQSLLLPHPASLPHTGIALGAEDDEGLESNLDPQRLPLRYPLGNIRIARGAIEASAELTASRWNAVPVAPLEDLAQPLRLAQAEAEPRVPGPVPESDSEAAPGALLRWDLPFAAATALEISPARPQEDTRTAEFCWPQAPPVLPSASPSATSFLIQLADAVQAVIAPPPVPGPVPGMAAASVATPLGLPVLATHVPGYAPIEPAPLRLAAHPGVQFTGTVEAIVSSALLAPQPVPLTVAISVPGYVPLDRALLRPPTHLETRPMSAVAKIVSSESLAAQPVPLAVATPVPGYVPLDRALLRPPTHLETQLIGAAEAVVTTPCGEMALATLATPRPEPLAFATPAPGYAPPGPALLRPPAHPEAPFAGAVEAAIMPTAPASLTVPRSELLVLTIPAPGYAPHARALLRPPVHPETPFAGAVQGAIRPTPLSTPLPGTAPASLVAQRQEPLTLATPAPSYTPDGRALLRTPIQPETSFAAAKPLRISPPHLQIGSQTEEFLWSQVPPVLPSSISFANSFRVHMSGTASITMTLPATSVTAFAAQMLAQDPIPSAWVLKPPVSGCVPLDRTPLQALAFLEPRGIGPAGRNLVSGLRELPMRSRRAPEFRQGARTGSVRFAHPSGTWEFASGHASAQQGHVLPMPVAWVSSTEDIHPMGVRVQAPGIPARPEPLLSNRPPARIRLGVHDQPRQRFGAFGLPGIQRFRAAALIQIREPELRNSAPSDLPVLSTSLPWPGVRMVSKFPLGATPVPLRPAVQNPSVC